MEVGKGWIKSKSKTKTKSFVCHVINELAKSKVGVETMGQECHLMQWLQGWPAVDKSI